MLVNWLLSRLGHDDQGEVDISYIYKSFRLECTVGKVKPKHSKVMLAQHLIKLFPEAVVARPVCKGQRKTVYKGISLKTSTWNVNDIMDFKNVATIKHPSFTLKSSSPMQIVYDNDSGCKTNGNTVLKTLTFNSAGTFDISVSAKEINLEGLNIDNSFHLNGESVLNCFDIADKIRLCYGIAFKQTMMVGKQQTLDNWSCGSTDSFRSLRSLNCCKVVLFTARSGVNSACRVCHRMDIHHAKECNNFDENIQLMQSDESNIDDIKRLFPNAPNEMINVLLEQSENVGKHPQGRRWSKTFIGTCLQLFNRSPTCYQLLIESKLLVMPSKSLLILYKNKLKQEPGFDMACFEWMYEEANKQGMSTTECIGGLIFDEMAIQSDIQIEKNGSVVELTGFTDLGQEGDLCNTLRKGSHNKIAGTHILQFIFLGINGFRFPFAHFITDNIQASELYGMFWRAVKLLHVFGFKAIYTCMDGAQCNRSFMHICLIDRQTKFTCPNPCVNNQIMIFIMDISHVIKKIRNNILKSGFHKSCTRLLTLPSKFEIHWQMFIDFYSWDQQNGLQLHRKLTSEHINLDSQLKMRNYLAEDVLNSEMLHSMKVYQKHLGDKGIVLNGIIELLEHTSKLVDIFRDMRPIKTLSDNRICQLKEVDMWFTEWESSVKGDHDMSKTEKTKCLMSQQCHEDIHASLQGFVALCETVHSMDTPLSITPALVNSDCIENIFNQQRSTYNGANTNPTSYQYKKTINSIIIGQSIVSKKANAANTAASPFTFTVKDGVRTRKAQHQSARQNIKVIKL